MHKQMEWNHKPPKSQNQSKYLKSMSHTMVLKGPSLLPPCNLPAENMYKKIINHNAQAAICKRPMMHGTANKT